MKANKGAPGIDGITVNEIGEYLKENQRTIIAEIYKGKYTPNAVRRSKTPKPDGERPLLKAPCTEGYTGCCERTGVNYSLLLDYIWLCKNRIVITDFCASPTLPIARIAMCHALLPKPII